MKYKKNIINNYNFIYHSDNCRVADHKAAARCFPLIAAGNNMPNSNPLHG